MAALSTLDEVKKYKGFTSSNADEVLTMLIDAASALVEEYLGYSPLQASHNEWFNGKNNAVLLLPNRPVTAIASLTIGTRVVPLSTAFNNPGYSFDEIGVYLRSYVFARGLLNINIQYTAGYNGVAALPAAIKTAVAELVWTKYASREWLGYRSKSLAGETTTYDSSDMSKTVMGYLNLYRKVTPI